MKRNMITGLALACAGAAAYAGLISILPPALRSLSPAAVSDVPTAINHQGVVTVEGVRFTGSGQFKFAIIDTTTGFNLWTNDGSALGQGGAPTSSVGVTITDGVYSVRLGASPMTAISPSLFANGNLKLRIWFDDGTHGTQQLAPDHDLTSVPYAMTVADGAIAPAKLASDVAVVPVGTLCATARSSSPSGWLLCDGSPVSRSVYAALFSAIGTTYGAGDGSTTFNLPDLRGRVPVGVDGAANRLTANDALANSGGEERHTLTSAESGMPAHSHGINDPGHNHAVMVCRDVSPGAGLKTPWSDGGCITGNYSSTKTTGITIQNATAVNASQSHNVMQPYVIVNYIIKF